MWNVSNDALRRCPLRAALASALYWWIPDILLVESEFAFIRIKIAKQIQAREENCPLGNAK